MAVVGHADHLGLVAPADRHQHRPEDLLARQAPVVGTIGEHGRHRVVALAQRTVLGRQAAEHQLGIGPLQALFDILADLGELLVVDDGADIGLLVQRIADLEHRGLLLELLQEGVEDVLVQEHARAGRAALALAGEAHGIDDAVDRPVLVGVGIDDRRALAAEFQRHRHDALCRRAHHDLADLGRASEGELADVGVVEQRSTHFLSVAGQQVENARRQELLADLGQQQHAERRILGRLHHHGVARAQRRRDLQRRQHDRRVPRDDGADHAQRLAPCVGQDMLSERDGLALELTAQPAEVAEDVSGDIRLAACLGAQRIAGLQRDRARHLLGALLQLVGDLQQHLAAVARRHLAPFDKGLGGDGHGVIHIGGVAARHIGDRLLLGRVLDRDARARRAVDPLAADQHALGRDGVSLRIALSSGCRHAGPPVTKTAGSLARRARGDKVRRKPITLSFSGIYASAGRSARRISCLRA